MSAHRTTLVVAVIVTAASACGAPPAAQPPRTPVVNVPAARQRVLTARERIEAALARHERARAPRVELTAAPESLRPKAAKAASLAQAPSPRPVIVVPDDSVPSRVLAHTDLQLRRLESASLARVLLRECFGTATGPEVVVSDLELDGRKATVEGVDATRSPSAACVRKHLAEQIEANGRSLRLRISARFVPRTDGAGADAARGAASATSVDEEITELARMLEGSADTARMRELVLLLGARQLDAARLSATARDEHLTAARAAFEHALVMAGTDVPARAAALHGLATSLSMLGKLTESVRAARALACPSRYPSPSEPITLDQDHPEGWWTRWESVHPTPIGATKPAARKLAGLGPGGPRTWDEETKYRSPYEGCTPPSDVPAIWVADAWRDIAAFHAESDPTSGPFHDNRAATALRHALASSSVDSAPYVTFELGRVLVHQQRYGEAARVLARLGSIADVRDRELVERAAQLVATSLTYLDLEGPSESEPMVDRPDVLDIEPNPLVAEKKLQVVVDRIDRPELVPQNETFTPLVLHWMAWELQACAMNRAAIAAQQKFLSRFPNHRDAPLVQWEQTETYTMMSLYYRPGSPEIAEPARLAGEARARLSSEYVGSTPWTDANRNDPEALQRAVDLARAKP
jgi:hypothetical protein